MSLSLPSQRLFCNSPPVPSISTISYAVAAVIPSRRIASFSSRPIVFHRVDDGLLRFPISLRCPGTLLDRKSFESSSSFSSTSQIDSDSDGFDLDSFLSFAELLCIVSSAVCSVVFAVNRGALGEIGKKLVLAWGFVGLIGGVAIGAWIRRRQWRRMCRESVNGERLNLIERIEKLEEDLKSSSTIVRVLSRQVEKLGIRFRITRKSLKEPIAETAALAQKNSEATRALAAQEDVLEKEIGETQKVLLAMQEQQQKQLELILAIAKNSKLFESNSKKASNNGQIDVTKQPPHISQAKNQEIDRIETRRFHKDNM